MNSSDVRQALRGLRPVLGRKVDALEAAYLSAQTPAERQELDIVIELLTRQVRGRHSVLLNPPSGDEADGPIRLGRIVHGRHELGWLGLEPAELSQHMAVMGRSGSGKSTLCLRLLLQLKARGVPFLAFDFKRSARHVLSMSECDDVTVLSLGRDLGAATMLAFNPMVPNLGTDAATHRRQLVELIARTWCLGDGATSLLERAMIRSSEQRGAGTGSPPMSEVLLTLRRMGYAGRARQWFQTAQRAMEHITSGPLGRVVGRCSHAEALSLLRHRCTILEMDGLAIADATFLVQCLLTNLTAQLLAEDEREQLKMVVFVDEAHHLLGKRDGARESTLETVLREGREIGLGVVIADQCISSISPTALANCFTVVCMNARQRADVHAGAASLLLSDEQKSLLSVLPVGEAVCRLSDRFPHPVHIHCPELSHLRKGAVRDHDVVERFLASPFAQVAIKQKNEARRADGVFRDAAFDSGDSTGIGSNPPIPSQGRGPGPIPAGDGAGAVTSSRDSMYPTDDVRVDEPSELEPDAQQFLRSVGADPFLGLVERATRLGLSRRKGHALKTYLRRCGYVKQLDLPTRRGKTVVLELTDRGRAWLQRHHAKIAPISGSLRHAWYQDYVCRTFAQHGWQSAIESEIDGHRVDVSARRGSSTVLVEIETGKSDWVANIDWLERARATHRLVVWLDPSRFDQVRVVIPPDVDLIGPRKIPRWVEGISA